MKTKERTMDELRQTKDSVYKSKHKKFFESNYKRVASHEAEPGTFTKVLLLYSGGLDTSVITKHIQEEYKADVYCLCVGIGQSDDVEYIRDKALKLGAKQFEYADVTAEFADTVCRQAIKANVDYEDGYRLFCPLGRVQISKTAVEYAEKWGCEVIAHGCTGKGNDQIRFENYVTTLNPELKILAPVREWEMGREQELAYAADRDIPVEQSSEKIYSYDENIWGCSAEGGEIEVLSEAPNLPNILKHVSVPEKTPDTPEFVDITFSKGEVIAINGYACSMLTALKDMNELGAKHGVGLTHLIEDRVMGLKVRGVYEEPGAEILIQAHMALEKLVCTREEYMHKKSIDQQWTNMVYEGRWFHPLMHHLNAYIDSVNKKVSGIVTMKVYKTTAECVAIKSKYQLFEEEAATFMSGGTFNQNASAGFIEHFGYSQRVGYNKSKDLYS